MTPLEMCSYVNWKVLLAYYIADKVFELWLGKTDKVKSGSMLELIWNGIKAVFKKGEPNELSGN